MVKELCRDNMGFLLGVGEGEPCMCMIKEVGCVVEVG